MASNKVACSSCKKPTTGYICRGCSESFCFEHLTEHRQKLSQQLDEIELDRDQSQQSIQDKKQNLQNHSLVKEINEWEKQSIDTVKQTAEECRRAVQSYIDGFENQFIKFTEELKEIRKQNEFNEIDLDRLKNKLKELNEELVKPSTICLERASSPSYIEKISIIPSSESDLSHPPSNAEPEMPPFSFAPLQFLPPSTPTTVRGSRPSMFAPQYDMPYYLEPRFPDPYIRGQPQRMVRPRPPINQPLNMYPFYSLSPQSNTYADDWKPEEQ